MARTRNNRTAGVARRRGTTRPQSTSRPIATPPRQQRTNALSNVIQEGIRYSPSPRTRAAQRLDHERLLAANEAAMNGPPDPQHALTELIRAGNPPAARVPTAARVPAPAAAATGRRAGNPPAARVPAAAGMPPPAPAAATGRRHGTPRAGAPRRAAPNHPPPAPIVPDAGAPAPGVPPQVAGLVAPTAVDINPADIQHGQAVSRTGGLGYVKVIVKDHIYPKIKFPTLDEDLAFSNDPRSICRQMATLASISDVEIEAWWNLTRRAVFETIKRLRNNSIGTLGTAFKGNFVVMDVLVLFPALAHSVL